MRRLNDRWHNVGLLCVGVAEPDERDGSDDGNGCELCQLMQFLLFHGSVAYKQVIKRQSNACPIYFSALRLYDFADSPDFCKYAPCTRSAEFPGHGPWTVKSDSKKSHR